jgi:(p)ppGpp synthase/HD superfamily hydrolase
MEVNWQVDKGESFKVKIHVKIENRRGMLALIANTIIKININIENIELEEREHVMEGFCEKWHFDDYSYFMQRSH